mmetsp:Transcript_33146/g.56687  ORF Transcript_33146/g.56687 Transcript_33146/m.56687 type:complete len:205 (-) Transcript_33146:1766-2380(-)
MTKSFGLRTTITNQLICLFLALAGTMRFLLSFISVLRPLLFSVLVLKPSCLHLSFLALLRRALLVRHLALLQLAATHSAQHLHHRPGFFLLGLQDHCALCEITLLVLGCLLLGLGRKRQSLLQLHGHLELAELPLGALNGLVNRVLVDHQGYLVLTTDLGCGAHEGDNWRACGRCGGLFGALGRLVELLHLVALVLCGVAVRQQ